jgi:hypothetical protein
MRKIINSTYITLDAVVEAPHLWPSLGRPGDERAVQIQTDLLLSCDAVLMGRRTYDGFAPIWPTRSGDPYSDHINAMPKYVVSTTLKDPEWKNTHVIDRDVVAGISRLKTRLRQGHRPVRLRGRLAALGRARAARRAATVDAPAHPRTPRRERSPVRRRRACRVLPDGRDDAPRRDRGPQLPNPRNARRGGLDGWERAAAPSSRRTAGECV